jgi:hypothetical protein
MLDEEIARLPDHLRAAVVMCELGGVGRKDASIRLGVPEGTISSRLAKARRLLAGRLRGLMALPVVLLSDGVAVPAVLSKAAIRNVRVNLGHTVGTIPAAVHSLSREVTRVMVRNHLRIGIAVLLVAVGSLLAASSAEPIPIQPPKAPPPRIAEFPKPAPSPKDRVLAAWEGSQKNLKSGIGEGIYEYSSGFTGKPMEAGDHLKYAVKVYHEGKKFRVELDYLSGCDAPPPSEKIVVIYDGETFAYREVNIKFRPHGEEARLESVQDGKLRGIIGYLSFFAIGRRRNLPV